MNIWKGGEASTVCVTSSSFYTGTDRKGNNNSPTLHYMTIPLRYAQPRRQNKQKKTRQRLVVSKERQLRYQENLGSFYTLEKLWLWAKQKWKEAAIEKDVVQYKKKEEESKATNLSKQMEQIPWGREPTDKISLPPPKTRALPSTPLYLRLGRELRCRHGRFPFESEKWSSGTIEYKIRNGGKTFTGSFIIFHIWILFPSSKLQFLFAPFFKCALSQKKKGKTYHFLLTFLRKIHSSIFSRYCVSGTREIVPFSHCCCRIITLKRFMPVT